jgi:hypothetical protein
VKAALRYLKKTETGQRILRGIILSGREVTIQPSPWGNSVAFRNEQALNLVAAEVIAGNIGLNTVNAITALGIVPAARAHWLHRVITHSPQWELEKTPGSNNGFWSMIQTAKQKANSYLLWSGSSDGYFKDESWFGTWGVGPFRNSITQHEVAGWLQGNALPAHLSDAEKNHAKIATVVALRENSARNTGSPCDIGWDNDPNSDLNRTGVTHCVDLPSGG